MSTKHNDIILLSLKACRVLRELTQKELADKIGVSRKTINTWEKEKKKLSTCQKIALSKVLDIPMIFFDF